MKKWYEEFFKNYANKYEKEPFTKGTIGECDFIEKEIGYNKDLNILDVGCGTGSLLAKIYSSYMQNEYYGLDIGTYKNIFYIRAQTGKSVNNLRFRAQCSPDANWRVPYPKKLEIEGK